jgi:hypothetical protein
MTCFKIIGMERYAALGKQALFIFGYFWGLWAVNAALIFVVTLGAQFNLQSAMLAAMATIGEFMVVKFLE